MREWHATKMATATLSFKNPLQKPTGDVHFFTVYGSGLKLNSWRATALQSLASTSSKSHLLGRFLGYWRIDLDYLDQLCLIRVGARIPPGIEFEANDLWLGQITSFSRTQSLTHCSYFHPKLHSLYIPVIHFRTLSFYHCFRHWMDLLLIKIFNQKVMLFKSLYILIRNNHSIYHVTLPCDILYFGNWGVEQYFTLSLVHYSAKQCPTVITDIMIIRLCKSHFTCFDNMTNLYVFSGILWRLS